MWAYRTAPGVPPTTPSWRSRTSWPWQYGQCRTSRAHRSRSPWHVGKLVTQAGGDQQRAGRDPLPAREGPQKAPGTVGQDIGEGAGDALTAVAGDLGPSGSE